MITIKEIAERTGKRHCDVLRDARKMFNKLYGPDYPFRTTLSFHEVFAMITGTGWLPLADILIPNPKVIEYGHKAIRDEIFELKCKIDSLNKKIGWRSKTCNEIRETLGVEPMGVRQEDVTPAVWKRCQEYGKCYFTVLQYGQEIDQYKKHIKELEEMIK